MSAQAIEAQIDQISLEIERRTEVFMAEMSKLESSKRLLQRQLNAVRDPIARLPLEISSEIFLLCLPLRPEFPSGHPRPHAHIAPLLLLNVCHTWTNIALSTPALWASISIGFPHPTGFECLLEGWLRRSGCHPLQISLRGACTSRVTSAILEHSAQLQSLRLLFDESELDDLDYELLLSSGILLRIRTELPCLQALEIVGKEVAIFRLMWPPVRRLLHFSSNLTELNIQNVSFSKSFNRQIENPGTLVLPHLRHLTHLESFDVMDISAPRLETLYVSARFIFTEGFISFLRQSSPPLWKLKLHGSSDVGSLPVEEPMSLIPTLTHLESLYLESRFVAGLLDFLAQHRHIAPNLETVQLEKIYESYGDGPIDILTPLAGILSARRGGLRKVRLTTISSSTMETPDPSDDLAATLRQFVADGVDIHVGSARDELNILAQ